MNPLGALPPSTSTSFALDKIDAQKLLRQTIVWALTTFATLGVPYLTGIMYTIGGSDVTVYVVGLVNLAGEAVRRLLTNSAK